MIDVGIKFPNTGDFTNHNVIENGLNYIFSYPTERHPDRKPKPLHFLGVPYIGQPPQIDKLIACFKLIRESQSQIIPQQIWHFIINFPIRFSSTYSEYFYFADAIASLFSYQYPVAYSYHTENKTSGNRHLHFHYIISTSSYISDHPALDADHLMQYLVQMPAIAERFNINLYFHQSQEELQCLNLTKIF